MQETISYPKNKIIEAIKQINAVVVSLDRMGSYIATLPIEQQAEAHYKYEIDYNIFRKLSTARSLLHSVFSRELGEDDMDELEREMQNIEYWNVPKA